MLVLEGNGSNVGERKAKNARLDGPDVIRVKM